MKTKLKKVKKSVLVDLVASLLDEIYKSEIIDTDMQSEIGQGKTYADKADWIDSKLYEHGVEL